MDEEIREERLDSPLVVHKKNDASYQETANEVTMSATHTDEETADEPTLERHRFRKKKKKKKAPYVILALVAIAVAVICALIYNGVIPIGEKETTTQPPKKSYTTQAENQFAGIITVKNTFIFFEGKEVDGIEGLEKEIKYLDAGASFVVQDENADSDFLNFEVLSLLSQYNINYEIKHIVSSGLESKYEKKETTAKSTTAKTTAKESTSAPVSQD